MKQLLTYAALLVAAVLAFCQMCEVENLKEERDRLSVQLAQAQIPLQRDTIRDSIEVVSQVVVEVVPKKLKEALASDRQLIKELQLRIGQLQALQTTTIETSDTVPASYQQPDSCFYYSDQWADLQLSLKDSTFYYNIRDSLATVVYREYRHHFLWWRWGTKGYQVKIVNFNPHARVTYNKYVKAEK